MDENVLKISVHNSDAGRKYDLYLRDDRYRAFQAFLLSRRLNGEYRQSTAPGIPGLSWAAFTGLDAIFYRRPKSFPARDIVRFIADDTDMGGAPAATPHEVESALEHFSVVYPPDVSENA